MKNYKIKAIASSIFIALLCLTACNPYHKVLGTDTMKVYEVEEVNDSKYGKYRYNITDGTEKGWQLKTDSKFEVGDYLEIVKKGT